MRTRRRVGQKVQHTPVNGQSGSVIELQAANRLALNLTVSVLPVGSPWGHASNSDVHVRGSTSVPTGRPIIFCG
eukprot:m.803034 g.803034  ORF g.803034 m.803034 type:complete len:74 (-) comp23364_c0_seq22:3404-3625(-)